MYTEKTAFAARGNYGGARPASAIKYLIYHYTANDGDSDEGNGNYFQQHIVQASAHDFVDDDSVTHSVPYLSTAWSVGGRKWDDCGQTGGGSMYEAISNTNSISIEMCDTVRDGKYDFTETTLANAAELGAKLMHKFNIPIDHVYRHFDVNGKHCPGVPGWWGDDSHEWETFKKRLEAVYMGMVMHKGYQVDEKLLDKQGRDNVPRWVPEAVKWATDNKIIAGDPEGDLQLRGPLTREAFLIMLYAYDEYRSAR